MSYVNRETLFAVIMFAVLGGLVAYLIILGITTVIYGGKKDKKK